jgi:hypothetical protein
MYSLKFGEHIGLHKKVYVNLSIISSCGGSLKVRNKINKDWWCRI